MINAVYQAESRWVLATLIRLLGDIVQPPGIGISPIADMDANQTIVTTAPAPKSSAVTRSQIPASTPSASSRRAWLRAR